MFCQYCGTRLRKDARFCRNCGTRVEEYDGPAAPVQQDSQPLRGDEALTQPWKQNENAFILPIPRALRQEEIQDLAPDRDEEIIPIMPSRVPVVVDSPMPVQRPAAETPIRRTETISQPPREMQPRAPERRPASPPVREPQPVEPPPTVPSMPKSAPLNGRQTQLIDRPVVAPKPEVPPPAPAKAKVENYRALEDDALFFDPTADPYELPAPPGFPPYQEPELPSASFETVGTLLKEEPPPPPPPPMPPPMPPPVIPPAVLLSDTVQPKKHMLLGAPLLFLAILLLFVFAFMSK